MLKIKRINDIEISYDDSGNGPETILFVHDLFLDQAMWHQQTRALAEAGYRTMSLDLRGHGKSSKNTNQYDIPTLITDLYFFLKSLDTKVIHLVGNGLGGILALRVALLKPDFLKTVILMNTPIDGEENPAIWRTWQGSLKKEGWQSVKSEISALYLNKQPGGREIETELSQYIEQTMTEHDPLEAALLIEETILKRSSQSNRLYEIAIPVFILNGEENIYVSTFMAQCAADGLREARITILPGAGHLLSLQQPQLCTAEIKQWLKKTTY